VHSGSVSAIYCVCLYRVWPVDIHRSLRFGRLVRLDRHGDCSLRRVLALLAVQQVRVLVLVLVVLRKHHIQNQRNKPRDYKARRHDQLDGINQAGQAAVVARVRKHIRKPVRHQRRAHAHRKRRRQDKPVAARKRHQRDDADAGDGHAREQKRRHAAQHRRRDGDQRGGKLGEHAHDDQEEAAAVARLAVCAARQRDDAVVLRKRRHGRDGAQPREQPVEAVGEHAAADARVKGLALDVQPRHVARGGDVADGLHHEHHVQRQQRQDERRVDLERERLDPDERRGRRGADGRGVKVAARRGDDAADQQAQNHGAGLHDGRAEALAQDDGEEHQEAEPDVLRAAPGERVRRGCVGAERSRRGVGVARALAAGPVFEPAADQADSDQQHRRAGDERREDALQQGDGHEREPDLEQRAETRRAQDGAVAAGAGELGAGGVGGTVARRVHLGQRVLGDGQRRERRAAHGDQARADVVGRAPDAEARDLDQRQDARDDQRRRHEVLGCFAVKAGRAGDGEGGGDYYSGQFLSSCFLSSCTARESARDVPPASMASACCSPSRNASRRGILSCRPKKGARLRDFFINGRLGRKRCA
jgi:hypothetical protein